MQRRQKHRLSVVDHDRNAVEMTYVYPVVSRRAGGVSIGINLNPNNACNWRCVYCQVPDLSFGKAPIIDLELLDTELRQMFNWIQHGDFLAERVPVGARQLKDAAISGNGEPTSSAQLEGCLEVLDKVLNAVGLAQKIPVVLITNGSLVHKPHVQAALKRLKQLNGVVWFKLDSATAVGSSRINSCHLAPEEHLSNLRLAATLCPTWLQTCLFQWDGIPPSKSEQSAYLQALHQLMQDGVPILGVHLYTIARASHQPEANAVHALPEAWLADFAGQIREQGVHVCVSA